MTVREAQQDELAATGALLARVYAAEGYSTPAYLAKLRDAASRARTASVLVAVDGDDLLGTVTLALDGGPVAEVARPGEAEFRMLVVDPAARGRGVAETLVQACADRARARGLQAVAISTQPAMVAARRLYERLGFVRDPERDWSPEAGVELEVLVLAL